MIDTMQDPPYTLGPEDKAVQVMAYTANTLYWGDLVVKNLIRVSTWLRTNNAPERICIYNAHAMLTSSAQTKPAKFRQVEVATNQINIFHMIPPAKEPPDYDPSEPNRKMMPVTILTCNFNIDGHLRLATSSSVSKFLEVARENFTSIYDAQICSSIIPSFGKISVPFVLVRQEVAVFAQA